MKEIDANKKAWSLLADDHYTTFYKILANGTYNLHKTIVDELGDIRGKKVLHLQCNTGADSICLAKLGARVTGVDLVPENIAVAKKLAQELDIDGVDFFDCDIMELMENHHEKYDIVFTSEGALIWIPNKKKWADTIAHLLKKDGFFYICDSHPFFLLFNEEKFAKGKLDIGYPYFKTSPDQEGYIGGYASSAYEAENYCWMYTVGDIINTLASAKLTIEFFNEHTWYMCGIGDAADVSKIENLYGKIPMMFSLKARY